tara:strand:+ start:8763 stop:9764 length:1002 start_codon:yes stop_codon:yes gene_type:complete
MSQRKFTLYWSNFKRYEDCPQSFLWYRGWGAIDVGGGPGRKKPKPRKDSRHHAVMGIVIQSVLEQMYNQEWWKTPAELVGLLEAELERQFKLEVAKNFIDWRMAGSKDEMFRICREGVFGFLKTFKAHRLVGQYARSELDYPAYINKWNPIGGRIDFLIRRDDDPYKGITLLDGKNSKHRGKYTDPDQLRFYALCFYLSTKVMPDRIGFLYFRFPHGWLPPEAEWDKDPAGDPVQPEPDSGVEWVEFTKDDLKGLAQRAVDARKGMDKEKFEATPKPPMCKLCDYESVCKERQAQIASNRRTPKNREQLFDGAAGMIEFGIGTEGATGKGKTG